MEQKLKDRLYDAQVCSPAQNYCRNRHVMEEAVMRIEELERKLGEAVSVLIFYGSICADKDKSPWNVYSEDFGYKARNFISKL